VKLGIVLVGVLDTLGVLSCTVTLGGTLGALDVVGNGGGGWVMPINTGGCVVVAMEATGGDEMGANGGPSSSIVIPFLFDIMFCDFPLCFSPSGGANARDGVGVMVGDA